MLLISAALAAPTPQSPEEGTTVGAVVSFAVLADQDVTVLVRQAADDVEPFQIAVLPDTQFYTLEDNLNANGDLFAEQTDWIADNTDNVAFVSHLGDIVQDWDDTDQWAVADAAMSLLDDVTPYGMVLGNHDYPAQTPEKFDQELFNTYFPLSRFEEQPWWGGGYPEGTNTNSFQTFSAGGMEFLSLHLQFEPPPEARAWASGVIADHPGHRVLISTHSHLGPDGEWWVQPSYDPGETTWADLIEPYDNVFMMLSAHVDGEASRTTELDDRIVHELLACYQSRQYGGGGMMRLLEFHPTDNRIDVITYSPWDDTVEDDADSAFSLDYPMLGWVEAGTASPEGGVAEVEWLATESGDYLWMVEGADGTESEVIAFSIDAQPPGITGVQASGLASKGIALVTFETSEEATAVIMVDGKVAGESTTPVTEHNLELTGLPAAFEIQIEAVDVVGNVGFTEPLWVKLGDLEYPDTGEEGPEDTGPAAATDSGAQPPAPAGCGCGGSAGWLWPGLFLLLPLRRLRTRGSSSVR